VIRVKNRDFQTICSATQVGTTHSGDMDTSFANTVRMACYAHFIMHLAGFSQNSYRMQTTGDDNTIFVRNWDYESKAKTIAKAFSCVFIDRNNFMEQLEDTEEVEHGLGQLAKFVKVGKLDDNEFCSTNCFETERQGELFFRVIRMPYRVLQTLGYKDHTSKTTHGKWLNDMAVCNLSWAEGIPFFGMLFNRIAIQTSRFKDDSLNVGPTKIKYPNLPIDQSELDYNERYTRVDNMVKPLNPELLNRVSKKDIYVRRDRVSSIADCDYENCLMWMDAKFGVTRDDIEQWETTIMNADFLGDEVVSFPGIEKFILGNQAVKVIDFCEFGIEA